jgi:tRNA pseudouridine13 synthase
VTDEAVRGGIPGDWLVAALDPPRASGLPPVRGRLRASPQDFAVEERLGFEPDGGAAHLLVRVEKTDANTLYVARALARFGGVRSADVGFAGLKDRRAVAVQWFSVPARRPAGEWSACAQDGFRVLEALPHSRKLKRGALAGNRFHITIRDLAGDVAAVAVRLERISTQGVPNYFGPQRFGRAAGNLLAVADWVGGAALPRDREQRAFVLSAARSLVFNQVLAARVAAGTWNRLLPGEVVNLAGSGSVFVAPEIDATLALRGAGLDLHPTGPLAGQGGVLAVGEAAAAEAAAVAPLAAVIRSLAEAEVEAARRPLRVVADGFEWSLDQEVLRVSFGLPRGAFATAVLREVIDSAEGDWPAEND